MFIHWNLLQIYIYLIIFFLLLYKILDCYCCMFINKREKCLLLHKIKMLNKINQHLLYYMVKLSVCMILTDLRAFICNKCVGDQRLFSLVVLINRWFKYIFLQHFYTPRVMRFFFFLIILSGRQVYFAWFSFYMKK